MSSLSRTSMLAASEAILTLSCKGATADFVMTHSPVRPRVSKSALSLASVKCDPGANREGSGDWGMETLDDVPGVLLVTVRSYVSACHYLILSIIHDMCRDFLCSEIRGFE